jgi:hypothetical protein
MTIQDLVRQANSANHSHVPIQVTDGDSRVLFVWDEGKGGWGWITLTDAEGHPYGGALYVSAPHANPAKDWKPARSPAEAARCYLSVQEHGNYPRAYDALRDWRKEATVQA